MPGLSGGGSCPRSGHLSAANSRPFSLSAVGARLVLLRGAEVAAAVSSRQIVSLQTAEEEQSWPWLPGLNPRCLKAGMRAGVKAMVSRPVIRRNSQTTAAGRLTAASASGRLTHRLLLLWLLLLLLLLQAAAASARLSLLSARRQCYANETTQSCCRGSGFCLLLLPSAGGGTGAPPAGGRDGRTAFTWSSDAWWRCVRAP